jgi:hypothetical protein
VISDRSTGHGPNALRPAPRAAHDARGARHCPARRSKGADPVEMVIGIALIVIAALEIWFIIRTVQANMGRA